MVYPSDSHGHDDVAVLVVLAVGGTELAGGLWILELEFYVAGPDCLQEIQYVLRVEADRQGIALVAGLERVFRLTGFGGRSGELDFAFFQALADGERALVGELGNEGDGRGQ